jgi:hypothetical protein
VAQWHIILQMAKKTIQGQTTKEENYSNARA